MVYMSVWKCFVLQIKKQNDNLQTRNMELVKANTDLRHKQSDSDNLIQNLKDKVSEQKKRIEYLNRSKKDLEENSERMKVGVSGGRTRSILVYLKKTWKLNVNIQFCWTQFLVEFEKQF